MAKIVNWIELNFLFVENQLTKWCDFGEIYWENNQNNVLIIKFSWLWTGRNIFYFTFHPLSEIINRNKQRKKIVINFFCLTRILRPMRMYFRVCYEMKTFDRMIMMIMKIGCKKMLFLISKTSNLMHLLYISNNKIHHLIQSR